MFFRGAHSIYGGNMKNNTTSTRKIALAGMLVALAVAGSLISFPVAGSKCAPVQHFINIMGAVILGPFWSLGIAFCASLLRNIFSLGSPLAFPGSMVGAFLAGIAYKKIKNIYVACGGELVGTSILGGLCAYPVALLIMHSKNAALFTYIIPFFISCVVGTLIAAILLTALKKAGILAKIQQTFS